MKAEIFVDENLLKVEDGKFNTWWNDKSKIKSLDVHAWYDEIKLCFKLEDGTTLCYDDDIENNSGSDIYGKIEWSEYFLLNLKTQNGRPTLQYRGRKLPSIRKTSLHFKKGELTSFEISGYG